MFSPNPRNLYNLMIYLEILLIPSNYLKSSKMAWNSLKSLEILVIKRNIWNRVKLIDISQNLMKSLGISWNVWHFSKYHSKLPEILYKWNLRKIRILLKYFKWCEISWNVKSLEVSEILRNPLCSLEILGIFKILWKSSKSFQIFKIPWSFLKSHEILYILNRS